MLINLMISKELIFCKKWQEILESEFSKDYFINLCAFLEHEYKKNTVYPHINKIFEAINQTHFNNVKVVIIGQDPYHGKGQANGIAFAIDESTKKPPSLKNILLELSTNLKKNTENVDIFSWANQGVLMLNSILTVRKNSPTSHKNQGWEIFTTKILEHIAVNKENVVFMLWGKYALEKIKKIDLSKHHVLISSHPSPLSSYRGFFGCKHFSKANHILKKLNKKEIKWI